MSWGWHSYQIFLTTKKKNGSIAVARSALPAILPRKTCVSFGKDQNVSRILKDVSRLRPSLPKHVDIILKYQHFLPDNTQLDLQLLTNKLCKSTSTF